METINFSQLTQEENLLKINNWVNEHHSSLALFYEKKLINNYQNLKKNLKNVNLFFAVKPLAIKPVLSALNKQNSCFDIASYGELKKLKKMNVGIERIFYSNPIKFQYDIDKVYEYGIRTFVVDNLYELQKLEQYKDSIKIMLRIAFSNKEAEINLSEKFGIPYDEALSTLQEIKNRGFSTVGISFHVGSRMKRPNEFVIAIEKCSKIFANAKLMYDIDLEILNIGGGFPDFENETDIKIEDFCKPINEALEFHFKNKKIYAEPGRSIVNSCIDLVTQVIGKAERNGKIWYYLNDGVYSSFSGCIYDHRIANFEILNTELERKSLPSVFAGPTCDSIDVMKKNLNFPELELGDLLISRNMGAYTLASATDFNMIKSTRIIKMDSKI